MDVMTAEEFKRAVEMYENTTPANERQPTDQGKSDKIYTNDHGDVVTLNDAAGNQIARVALDTKTVSYPSGKTKKAR